MAQNVGTPRFYVNIFEYLSAIGYTDIADVYRLNPTQYKANTNVEASSVTYPDNIFTDKSYIAYLGHQGGLLTNTYNFNNAIIINADLNGTQNNELSPEYEGFSIRSVELSGTTSNATYCSNPIGSISVGNYYDMPHSPDLNLKLSYEYDGVKTTQTKGGATLSNATYTKPADWGDGGAWQLGSDESGNPISNLRSGRRVWDLSFSYLSSDDLMPNLGVQNYEEGAVTEDILTGTDFFSQVINKTMGGHLPFIFQADGSATDPEPDQFAIARFDMNSFSYDQVANNVYNVRLKIREVW